MFPRPFRGGPRAVHRRVRGGRRRGARGRPAGGGYVTIAGSGSVWQSVAIDQWSEDVQSEGLIVSYNPDGSAAGRDDYMQGSQVDFAASDVAFRDGHDKPAALASDSPVARIGNPAGRYVLPAARNVTAALTQAKVNENPRSPAYLQENLTDVYTSKNPLSYPLSYYGYLIVPRSGTKLPPIFTSAAGRSLSTFVGYGLCAGQRQVAALGYAPLPRNLVAAGLVEVARIPGHVAVPPLSRCSGQARAPAGQSTAGTRSG